MDQLLNPEPGLVIWTVVTFLFLVFILKKLAWGPLIKAIEDREARIKGDLDSARASREAAQKAQSEIEAQMAGLDARGRLIIDEASSRAEALRLKIQKEAELQAQKIKEKTIEELGREKERLSLELRQEVAGLSILAAEKILRESANENVQKKTVDSFLADLGARGK
jgi:F-type H+-transporting ATPase subunit b